MSNFFDAFKMASCQICGKEVVLNGMEFHLHQHAIYDDEAEYE